MDNITIFYWALLFKQEEAELSCLGVGVKLFKTC